MANQLYTIGYSGYPDVDDFISELQDHGIQILIDVRSSPYSAYYENYNKEPLSKKLKENGIFYANYARQFGARQDNPEFYKDGRLDFIEFAKSPQFLDGVRSVEKSTANIVFMCAEKDPITCHRAILVARAFHDRGHKVLHIIPGKDMLTQEDLEQKLLKEYLKEKHLDMDQTSMFDSDEPVKSEKDYIVEAYQMQNEKIGYKPEDMSA